MVNWIPSTSVIFGGGQMGAGIALAMAVKIPTMRISILDSLDKAEISLRARNVEGNLHKWFGRKNSLAFDDIQNIKNIRWISMQDNQDWKAALNEAEFILEAVSEIRESKLNIFSIVANEAKQAEIIATNTSGFPISSLSHKIFATRFIGMHFMNPVPRMNLVEIIPSGATSKLTIERTCHLAEALGKTIAMSRDSPGFISNRILMPYLNEAVFALQEGIGTKEEIDITMKLGTNVPMGPLQLMDFIGLDTCFNILQLLAKELNATRFQPCPLLARYVELGWLGKKTGKGFYDYAV